MCFLCMCGEHMQRKHFTVFLLLILNEHFADNTYVLLQSRILKTGL